ncbi:MAG: response regulator transcription factor [Gemmatimonadota bacterium]
MRALLSPLEHERPDAWRATVNRAIKPLLAADMATFQLPYPRLELLISDEVDAAHLRRYLPTLDDRDPRFSVPTLEKTAELGVCNRRMLWRDDLEDYYRSSYYNEFIVPCRAFDMLCASTRLEGAKLPAMLYLHHSKRNGPRFGGRGVHLLRLLYPAFEAGVGIFQRFHAHRSQLFATLDKLGDCVCVFDMDARLLHRNAAYLKLSLTDLEAEVVAVAARELARSLSALCTARRPRGGPEPSGVARKVWVGSRTFMLEGSLLERAASGLHPSVIVTVHVEDRLPLSSPAAPSSAGFPQGTGVRADFAERFDLTPREAEVAFLLARRLTNRELAARLGISEHTARHHTERVLLKLDIHSRRQVAAKLAAQGEAAQNSI